MDNISGGAGFGKNSRILVSNFNLKKNNDIISGYRKRKHENKKKATTY